MSRLLATCVVLLGLAVAGCGGSASGQQADGARATGATPTPTPTAATEPAGSAPDHLRALQAIATASGGNRAAGTRGDRASQEYVAQRLRAGGWTVTFEPVGFPFFDERTPARLAGATRKADFTTIRFSGSGRVSAPTGRARGRGCAAADWRGVRAGQVAVVTRGTCTFATKARFAQQRRAAALLVVSEDGIQNGTTLGRPGTRIPVLLIDPDTRDAVLRRGRATLRTDTVSERRSTRNVLASRPGRGRIVTAGAHLDSVTEGPGANDNGSGSAALLAAAERLGPTTRPVQLGFWGAEELGLLGSREHVSQLSRAEREQIAVHVNLDMVGTPDPKPLVAADDDALRGTLARALRAQGVRAKTSDRLNGSSDHASFERAGVPSAFVHTGLDRCYHRACDTAGKVDAAVMTDVSRATRRALERLANP